MQQPNYAIAALAASQRASRAPAVRPFKLNCGGPFRPAKPVPAPSLRAADVAAERVARAKADAAALRAAYAPFAGGAVRGFYRHLRDLRD